MIPTELISADLPALFEATANRIDYMLAYGQDAWSIAYAEIVERHGARLRELVVEIETMRAEELQARNEELDRQDDLERIAKAKEIKPWITY